MTGPVSLGVSVSAVVLGLAVLGLVAVFASGARAGRRAQRAVQRVTRIGGVLGSAAVIAAGITLVQWVAIRPTAHPALVAAVLAVPALFAALMLARLGTVTVSASRRARVRGGRR